MHAAMDCYQIGYTINSSSQVHMDPMGYHDKPSSQKSTIPTVVTGCSLSSTYKISWPFLLEVMTEGRRTQSGESSKKNQREEDNFFATSTTTTTTTFPFTHHPSTSAKPTPSISTDKRRFQSRRARIEKAKQKKAHTHHQSVVSRGRSQQLIKLGSPFVCLHFRRRCTPFQFNHTIAFRSKT